MTMMTEQMDATIHVGVNSSGFGLPSAPPAMANVSSFTTSPCSLFLNNLNKIAGVHPNEHPCS
jgi:hypothetical protein